MVLVAADYLVRDICDMDIVKEEWTWDRTGGA